MFLGHYGIALGAKRISPSTSLGTYVLASQLIDLIWPIMLLLGYEQVQIVPGITLVTPLDFTSYPYTHSLLAVAVWAALFGLMYFVWRRSIKASLVLGLLVVNHWVLDLFVHRPDLPLAPDSDARFGLGLWNSLSATMTLEFGIFLLGVFLYVNGTRARDGIGRYAFSIIVLLMMGIYLASVFGAPPPDARTIAIVGLGQVVFVALFYWIDRHRRVYGH